MACADDQKQSIGIIGQGAIGGLIGYRCEQLTWQYGHILRQKQSQPLSVTNLAGATTTLPIKQIDKSQLPHCDLLLLPVKAYQVLPALEELKNYIHSHHSVVLLHNGMGTVEQVRTLLPNNALIAATTSDAAFKPKPNSIIETGSGQTHFGWIQAAAPEQQGNIEKQLSALFVSSTWHTDVKLALWKKLAVNALINPISALNNIKNGELAQRNYQQQLQALCIEIAELMSTLGYPVSAQTLLNNANKVIASSANNYSSMQQDIAKKRRTEIDFINGYIVNQAQQLGKSVPLNQALVAQIKELETSQG